MQKSSRFLTFLLLLTGCVMGPVQALAQLDEEAYGPEKKSDTIQRSNIITSYPISFFFSSLKLGYEGKIGNKKSMKLIATYGASDESATYNASDVSEYGLEVQPRFFINRNDVTMFGFFTGPYIAYSSINFKPNSGTFKNQERSTSVLSIGYFIGYEHVFPSNFTFEIFAGGGINNPSGNGKDYLKDQPSIIIPYKKGIMPRVGIGLGLAF